MNLFELFVKIGVDDQASGKLSNLSNSLGKGLATAAKIGTAAVTAAATAITTLTTAAVNNYAQYEQLTGGVKTLFNETELTLQEYAASVGKSVNEVAKEWSDMTSGGRKVMVNASNAFKTAGMSANQYMETVTSFSASLIQSLGGDTDAAARMADMAITDMADNANKMGADLSTLQTAYAGFAKGQFMLLDNLKLGYQGTKGDMERLLADAQAISGIKYDISSYADIVDAIHVIQTEMGIAGATAAEAGTTIEGSVNSMKAAWQNLVTGFADKNADIELLIDDLVTTIVGDGTENNLGVIGNVLPAVETALGGIAQLIEGAAPKIIEILPGLVDSVVPSLISAATSMVKAVVDVLPGLLKTVVDALVKEAPKLIKAAVQLVKSLVKGIKDNYKILIDGAITIVEELVNGVVDLLPEIIKLGLDLIVSLANGIAKSLPELIPTIVDVVLQIVDTLTDPATLSNLIDSAIAIIFALADGLIAALPNLLEQAPVIVQNLVDAIVENAPKLLGSAFEIIVSLVEGIISNLPQILEAGTEIVFSILEGITQWLGDLIMKGKDIVDSVKDGFSEKVEDAKTWGKDLIDNFIGGITEKWNDLKEKVSSVAQTVKDYLGFSEPKKGPLSNFHTYAPDMMDLFIKGIKDNEKKLTDQIEKTFDFGDRTITAGISYGSYSNGSGSMNRNYGGGNISVVQNIYSEAKTAADLMQEAIYQQERAVLLGV